MDRKICCLCHRPIANKQDWDEVEEDERQDLCWGNSQCLDGQWARASAQAQAVAVYEVALKKIASLFHDSLGGGCSCYCRTCIAQRALDTMKGGGWLTATGRLCTRRSGICVRP